MADVKEHYDTLLSEHYGWMTAHSATSGREFTDFLKRCGVVCRGKALDLGAGNGLQSIPLASAGCHVTSVDFCEKLLDELKQKAEELPLTCVCSDLTKFTQYVNGPFDLILCCGDTLTHLEHHTDVTKLIKDISESLSAGGTVYFSFRDYSVPLTGTNRFIPVKSDRHTVMTCFLEYHDNHLDVTDMIYQYTDEGWVFKKSTYRKLRLMTDDVIASLEKYGLRVFHTSRQNGMIHLLAQVSENHPA